VSAQKWLLGPDVTGALYIRPDRREELRMTFPSYSSWDWEAEERYVPKATAARFDPGWIPTAAVEGLLESLAFAAELGAERFEVARAAAEVCRTRLAERHEVITEPDQATLVTWRAGGDPEEIVRELVAEGVVVRDLPGTGWVRASCGFWTSNGDLEKLVRGRI
jgi:L-cysteine/cystine lyase